MLQNKLKFTSAPFFAPLQIKKCQMLKMTASFIKTWVWAKQVYILLLTNGYVDFLRFSSL